MKEYNKNNESSDSLPVLIDLIPDPVIVPDSLGKIVCANRIIGKYTGYTKEQLIGKNFSELGFISKETRKLIAKNTKKRIAGSSIPPYEIKITAKNGEIKCLKLNGNRIISQGKMLDLAIFHDITDEDKIQKQMRQDLVKSEEKFHCIINSIKEAIITVDQQAKVAYWNAGAEVIFGYLSKEAIGKSVHELVVPSSTCKKGKECIEKSVKTFSQTGVGYFTVGNVELVGRHKNGKEFPAELSISPVKLSGKLNAVGVVKDITKRKQNEQKLREAEQRYHALFNQSPSGVLVIDPETTAFVEFNDIAHQQLGYSREEFEGKTFFDIEAKESSDELRYRLKEMTQNGGGELETKQRTQNGEVRDGKVIIRAFQCKGKTYLHFIFHDVTKNKEAEKALKEALRRERDMLEDITKNIGAGLVIIDKDYRVLWSNNFLKHINGDLLNKTCFSTFNTLNEICPGCGPKKIFEGASFDSREYFNQALQDRGLPCWFELIATPIKDANGKITAALELKVDITERKRLQTKLSEYSQKLEETVQKRTEQLKKTQVELVKSERLAAIGELVGMVGLDLRNPLTGIKNSAYFLKKKGSKISQAQSQEMLEIINKCVNYSNKIVNDLLDYSRQIRLDLQEESPKKLLADSLSMLNIPKNIKILNRLNDEPTLNVDPDKIKRIFINLIKNAVDAMPKGGKITIASKQVKGSVEVSFSDTGEGITDDVLPKLFSPLFTTKAQGMGFSLAICKRIIEAHNGTIAIKTVKEKGTTFTVTIPIDPKFEVGGENTWTKIIESSSSTMMKQ